MEATNYTMGMTMDVNDAGNADRQESQDANGSWNKQSHQALSSQPHHKEGKSLGVRGNLNKFLRLTPFLD